MFYPISDFPFLKPLEDNWEVILEEYYTIKGMLEAWPERNLYTSNWEILKLFEWPSDRDLASVAENNLCPKTVGMLKQIPGHGAAAYSRISAHSSILPHTGYPGNLLRCHIPLIVPEGDCAIRVGSEVRTWELGSGFVFDDRIDHEVWNRTDFERVILIVDFLKP